MFIYFSICKSSGLNQDLIANLTNLINGKSDYQCLFGKSLTELRGLEVKCSNDIELFFNTLKKYSSTDGLSLTESLSKSGPTQQPTYATSEETNESQNKDDENAKDLKQEKECGNEIKRPNDHIGYLKYIQQFNGQRENSGIIERFEYLMPYELEIIVQSIIGDLNNENLRIQAVACLLTLLLRCRPSRFHMIGLQRSEKISAWLDLERSIFCWDLNTLTEIKRENLSVNSVIQLPLPSEIVEILQEKRSVVQQATTIAQLFNISPDALDSLCKKYIKTKSLTSHRPTLTRMEETYGKYVSAIEQDEVYGAVIGLDFSLGVTSNFNYTVVNGEKLRKILKNVYLKLGFNQFELPELQDVTAPNAIDTKNVSGLINKLSSNIGAAFSRIARNISYERLCEIHNEISKNTLCLTTILTGHRTAEEYGFFAYTLDTDRKICLISDKRVSDYQWGRFGPVATLVANNLELYLQWLESLKNRLSKIDKKLSLEVNAIINATPKQPSPLFFSITGKTITSSGTKAIQSFFDEFNLPANCGRDFLDFILKKNNADSTTVMMIEGHASIGQEQISISSLIQLSNVLNLSQKIIDKEISEACHLKPPKFNPRVNQFNDKNLPKKINKTILSAKYIIKNSLAPQCPFNEMSIINLNKIKEHIHKWQSLEQDICIQDLNNSLCLIDGVASIIELDSIVNVLLNGTIHLIDGNFFVDTTTPELGYRRVWLSYLTVLIAANLKEENRTNEENENTKILIEAIQAQYIMQAPASLGLWANGKFSTRSKRPETLSREHFDQPEIPIYTDKSIKKKFYFDDKAIQIAINRANESDEYSGENEIRLKQLAVEIDEILLGEIDEISVLVLAKYTKYLTAKKLATSTILRYYSSTKAFVDIFSCEIDHISQLATVDWSIVIEEWMQVEKINTEENPPEIAAVNHFLDWVETITKISRSSRKLSCPVLIPIDCPSINEIRKCYKHISDDNSNSEAVRLEALVLLSLIAQHALRPVEISALRLIDIYIGESMHIVITSEALGRVKTINANRVLPIKDDEFNTKALLKKLHEIKSKNNRPESFLFADVDGSNLTSTHELFKIIRDILIKVTGHPTTIMSFRQFNATREISLAIKNAGNNPLHDRTSLQRISAQCGHGHALTTFENYGCDFDLHRKEFWENHKRNIKLQVPIVNIKARLGLSFSGNLATNKPTFEMLLELISLNSEFRNRIKNCREYVHPVSHIVKEEVTNQTNLAAVCKYVYELSIGTSIEDAVVVSRVQSNQKKSVDDGVNFISSSFFKLFKASKNRNFRDKLLGDEFQKEVNILQSLPIYQSQAIMLAQIIPQNIGSVINITHESQLDFFTHQNELFKLAGVEIYLCANKNIPIERRKFIRRMPFKTLPEQSFPKYIHCQLSFWLEDLPFSQRARNLSLVMQEINLILLTLVLLKSGA